HEQVGPRFLAPGQQPALQLLVVPEGASYERLEDMAVGPDDEVRRPLIGVVRGSPTATAVRERAEVSDDELQESGDLRLRPSLQRYDTTEALLEALAADELHAAVVLSSQFEEHADQFPTLVAASDLAGGEAAGGGFLLGTNQLGQDLFSRLIWGTRIALMIGFSSSLVALAVGVPLGLVSGYTGGKLDRTLTVIMDSLY